MTAAIARFGPNLPRRWIGRWLFGVGVLHTVYGLVTFARPLGAIAGDGVWNAVAHDPGRLLAVWFMVTGAVTLLLGGLLDWVEARAGALRSAGARPAVPVMPAWFGWGLLLLGGIGAMLLPISGMWLLLPPAVEAVRRGRARE